MRQPMAGELIASFEDVVSLFAFCLYRKLVWVFSMKKPAS
jgi:hypothetical protein